MADKLNPKATELSSRDSLRRFTFRAASVSEDVAAMLKVHNSCRELDRTDRFSVCYKVPNLTAEAYAKLLVESPATLLASEDGEVVAHAWMEVWGHDDRLYLWQVWVNPKVRRVGLGTEMHRWGESKARELHGNDPRPMLHLANATESEEDSVSLLLNEGYQLSFVSPELSFDLDGDLPPKTQTPNIEIRALKAADHRKVARALAEANLDSPGSGTVWTRESLENEVDRYEYEWIERVQSAEPSLSPVAWDDHEVVGAFLCERKGQVGEISQVAVREKWRGQGIARALCLTSLGSLKETGCSTARLFTSADPDELEPTDGPYAMCRKFGFETIGRHLRFRKASALK